MQNLICIESKDNAIYKETKKLKDRRNRNKQKKYLIEGFRLVEEALKAGAKIETIFCFDELESKTTELIEKYNYSGKIFKIEKSNNIALTLINVTLKNAN